MPAHYSFSNTMSRMACRQSFCSMSANIIYDRRYVEISMSITSYILTFNIAKFYVSKCVWTWWIYLCKFIFTSLATLYNRQLITPCQFYIAKCLYRWWSILAMSDLLLWLTWVNRKAIKSEIELQKFVAISIRVQHYSAFLFEFQHMVPVEVSINCR